MSGSAIDMLLILCGVLLAVAGLGLLLWSLAGDWLRHRGERRCPKCWYDLSGTKSLRCSECGYEAKRERKLHKSRRRWFRAVAALLLLALAYGAFRGPGIREEGWHTAAPTTLLILLMPDLPDWDQAAFDELLTRLDDAYDWQWQWLVDRCKGEDPMWLIELETRDDWPSDTPVYVVPEISIDSQARGKWPFVFDAPLRARVVPRFDDVRGKTAVIEGSGLASMVAGFGNAFSDTFGGGSSSPNHHVAIPAGVPPEGAAELQFDVVIERETVGPNREQWRVIDRVPYSNAMNATGGLTDYLEVDDSAELTDLLRQNLVVDVNNRALVVRTRDPLPKDLISAIAVELYRDGEVIKRWNDQWIEQRYVSGERLTQHDFLLGLSRRRVLVLEIPHDVRGDRRPLGIPGAQPYDWSVRIIGQPRGAVLLTDAKRCWVGEITVPLELIRTEELLLYTSDAAEIRERLRQVELPVENSVR